MGYEVNMRVANRDWRKYVRDQRRARIRRHIVAWLVVVVLLFLACTLFWMSVADNLPRVR